MQISSVRLPNYRSDGEDRLHDSGRASSPFGSVVRSFIFPARSTAVPERCHRGG